MSAAAGFHFSCTRCGDCCRVGHGRVWLERDDLQPLAAASGMSRTAFLEAKVVTVDGRLSLRERSDGGCILLEGQAQCTVYEARPRQCREFPHWPALREEASLAAAAAACPGIQRFPRAETLAEVLPQVAVHVERAGGWTRIPRGPEAWGSSLEADSQLAGCGVRTPADPEAARAALQRLAEDTGYPWSYGPWTRLLADRRAGWLARGGLPCRPPAS